MRRFFRIGTLLAILATAMISCATSEEQDEFHDWQQRNENFIDSISRIVNNTILPEKAVEGDFFRILRSDVDPSRTDWSPSKYIYCKVIEKGDGTGSPKSTDYIRMNYRGRLIPSSKHLEGLIFDQSYKAENIDPEICTPLEFRVSDLVAGVSLALQNMTPGDIWKVYIPYQLGYGTSEQNEIPGCSSLIFDINLTDYRALGESAN